MLARDLACMEMMDGLVDSGGDGRYEMGGGASKEVLVLTTAGVGAIDGD